MNEFRDRYNCVVYSPRTDYGSSPIVIHVTEVDTMEGFTSLYQITEESAEGILTAGTTAGFKGSVWSERLWIDLDSKETLTKIKETLNGLDLGYVVYFTGNRGFHIGVQRDNRPTHVLPEQDKHWVKSNFPYADLGIYTHLHLFRLPGTRHDKTGGRKLLVESKAGKSLIHAKYDRPTRVYGNTSNLQPVSSLGSVFSDFLVMSQLGKVRVGNRHATLVRTSLALRDRGFELSFTRTWLNEMNKQFQEQKTHEEIEKIVQDIYRR